MKSIRRFSLSIFLIVFGVVSIYAQAPCSKGTAYRGCKACGSAKGKKAQQLNVEKNRDEKVTNPEQMTVEEIRDPNNNQTFSPDRKVSVTGYVASVVSGGDQESCNCARNDLRDIHINIVASPGERDDQSKYVVVEFTPRWQEEFNLNAGSYQKMLKKLRVDIRHQWVRFEGPMLYDYFHANQSKSTRPNQPVCPNDGKLHKGCNWRATPWEVHPITAYTIVSAP